MRLIINNYNIELDESSKITRTLQVNDIIDLENRQSNYSATFKIPKTAKNVRSFSLLGIVGNNSNVPYQRGSAYLYSDTEECLVYNGWAIIKSVDNDSYSVNIIDGNIDLYKAIENKTLSDLDLSEANHFKTLDNVINSFNDSEVYKYILADYNGKALYDTDKINIDYLVPSIPVSYLWDKIFDTYGFTYGGQAFSTFAFQNLYLTYPKGTAYDLPDFDIYYNNTSDNLSPLLVGGNSAELIHSNTVPTNGTFLTNGISFVAPQDGTYVIDSTLSLEVFTSPFFGSENITQHRLYVTINGVDTNIIQVSSSSYPTTNPFYVQLFEGDLIALKIRANQDISNVVFSGGEINYSYLTGYNIDFNDTFIDFKTKDFIKEVLNRFGLTPSKNKYTNHYEFLTLYELLQNPNIEDWSSDNNKFVSLNSDKFIYGNYAQQNNFVYKYNDDESDYYNGSILIDNVNLEDSKDVVKSNIYAPELVPSNELPKQTNVYNLWDKEVKDDGSVTYKDLSKRFYLMRSDNYVFENPVTIGSELLLTETTISSAPFESFFKLRFNDIIEDYYQPLSQILDKAKVSDASIYLNDLDIENINFTTLKWIEETNEYYLLNKVSNYTKKGINKVELIKVDYVSNFVNIETGLTPMTIAGYNAGCLEVVSELGTWMIALIQYSDDDGVTWNNLPEVNGGGNQFYFADGTNVICDLDLVSGWFIRIYNTGGEENEFDNSVMSNIFYVL